MGRNDGLYSFDIIALVIVNSEILYCWNLRMLL